VSAWSSLRRDPAKQLRRRGRLRPVSRKRQAANRQRRVMADEIAQGEQPLCGVYLAIQVQPWVDATWCTRWADDLHESLSRARGGSITDRRIAWPLCRPCHDWITFRPESELDWAYELGLLVHSWDAPTGAVS
jgi:hypothetical protein